MKFLIIDKVHTILADKLQEAGYKCDYIPDIQREQVSDILKNYEGLILRSKVVVDKEFIDNQPQLKLIGRVGSGMENIDVDYAQKRGIICLNSPEGNRESVAEHAIALMINLLHNIFKASMQVRSGIWQREENRGQELAGKIVGIIGYGNTGSATARRLEALGATVLAYDKYKTGFAEGQIIETGLEKIFEHADIVSFHVPLTEETRFMADKHFFKHFRKNFYLINTSRGQVVKTSDLVKYLKKGKILGAGLDVLEYESYDFKMNAENPDLKYLLQAENVIITPHIAGITNQAYYKLSEVMARKIIEALR